MRELGYKRTVHSILAQLIASQRQSVKEERKGERSTALEEQVKSK